MMARSAKKGRRDAEDAEDAEACVVGSVITLALVVALVIALSFEAIRQLPSASVYDHKEGKGSELMHVVSRRAKWDVRRETIERR